MYGLMVFFISVVLLIGVFCVVVVCRDIVIESRERKNATENGAGNSVRYATIETPVVLPVAAAHSEAASSDEIAPSDEMAATAEPSEDSDNVVFAAGSQTLDEKYLELSPEMKGYYDEIVRFANTVEGSKRFKNANYEEYKIGKNRLVRLKIKRGVVSCELTIPNLQFKNYLSDNKVSAKQAPAVIKVTDESALNAVKDSIRIAVSAVEEAYKKEQARLRRKKRREEQAESAADEHTADESATAEKAKAEE